MSKSDGGKGSDRRPGEGYASGWDRIFGRKPEPAQENQPMPKPISEFSDSKTCRSELTQK